METGSGPTVPRADNYSVPEYELQLKENCCDIHKLCK